MMSREELLRQFEEGKALRKSLLEKKGKLEVTQRVAAEKEESLQGDLKEMGIDPEKVDEWLSEEEARLTKALSDFETKSAETRAELEKIEKRVIEASTQAA